MSQIETAVEPHLTPLILSEAITITPKVRRILNSRDGGSVKHLSATCNNRLAVRPPIAHFFPFNLPVAASAPNWVRRTLCVGGGEQSSQPFLLANNSASSTLSLCFTFICLQRSATPIQ
jgi:hypothetical protein